jgi:uncharacterized membrane protein
MRIGITVRVQGDEEMAWAWFALIYFVVGALALRSEGKVSMVKGLAIVVAWLPLLIAVHFGSPSTSHSTSQFLQRL